jgi:glycosyltransferase involved in cell wall biosynthesis
MRISHGTRFTNLNDTNGYGYATDRMAAALKELGHEFVKNDPDAPVQMCFDQPKYWKWNDSDQYRIGYHPWESTLLKPGWREKLNECDEVWTPSPLIADWYKEYAGVTRPIYVYQHGVDPIWKPKKRTVEDKIRFLHVGAEAARKGGLDVMRAFRQAFPNRDDVELTLKMINPGWNIPEFGKVKIMNRTLKVDQLVDLFHEHHVYVYPSWGEGFGLTPLQAMATGMPTLTVPAWAPYAHHLDERLSIPAKLHATQWPKLHPGMMFAPSEDAMIDRMRWVADNYDPAVEFAMEQTGNIAAEYDWLTLTDEAFSALQERLNL